MRIGFVCNEYPPEPHGGIGSATEVMARALVAAGHQVRVIGVHAGRTTETRENRDGVVVHRLPEPPDRLGWMRARMRLFRTVADWSRRGDVDLVEVPDWQGWAAGWPALPVPVVARLNGSASYFAHEMRRPIKRITRWLERASLRRADFWCSASRYTAERTRALFRLRAEPGPILYNPVERPPTDDENRCRHTVVFAGTLTAKKGIVSLVRAWPRVAHAHPEARLEIFGRDGVSDAGGSMRDHLQTLLPADVAGTVRFHGHVARSDVARALGAARVAVFPSYAEAFALVPAESMACGCPTIYTRRGSGPELIRDERDGLLADPDDPEGIARAIGRVLADDALAARLARAGRERIERDFAIERLLPQNEAFYRSCVTDFMRRSGRREPRLIRVAIGDVPAGMGAER